MRTARWTKIVLITALCGASLGLGDEKPSPIGLSPATGRELLNLHGVDSSHLDQLSDGMALGSGDEETLVRVLYHLPRLTLESLLVRSRVDPIKPSQLAANPRDHRAAVVQWKGRAKRVDKVELKSEVAQRTEITHYYRVTVAVDRSPYTAIVVTRTVPHVWRVPGTLDQPVGMLGMFLKTGETIGDQPQLVFAAQRLAWHPEQRNEALHVTDDEVFLAQLGVDMGLLDAERDLNRKPFVAEDRECFYQLLSAVRRSPREEMIRRARQPLKLGELLQRPAEHHGDMVLVTGQSRRVTKIRVDEPDIQQRYGIDHYYQVDVFIPLHKQVVVVGEKHSADGVPRFENTFPVTVCAASLPAGLREGSDRPVEIQIPAVFFKVWAYRSEFMSSFDDEQLQLSPLLIGAEPQVVVTEVAFPHFGTALTIISLLALVGIWYGLLRHGREPSITGKLRVEK